MRRYLYVLLSLAMILSSIITVGSASAATAKQVLRIGVEQLPDSLDPAFSFDSNSITLAKGLFEGLVRLSDKGEVVPGIAKQWKVSNDGKVYTFTLRSGAKWSNQQLVKASDFEYAWKRVLAPKVGNPYAFKMYMIANAQKYNEGKLKDASQVGVKALNNYTLQVTLTEKTSYFLQLLAESVYMPVNAAVAKSNPNWAYNAKSVVTNGPFSLKQWGSNDITLVKNLGYYASKEINWSEVHFLQPKSGTLTSAYLNNAIDMFGGDVAVDAASSIPAKEWSEVPVASSYYYEFNVTQPPFDNPKIRRALAMAVDRSSINYGFAPAYGLVPWNIHGAGQPYRSQTSDTDYFQGDVEQAQELLKEGLKEEGLAELPPFSIIVNAGNSHVEIAEAVISSWEKNLGIKATSEIQSWDELLANRSAQNFSIARAGWAADYNDPSTFLECFTSWSPNNETGWSDPTYDGYIKQAQQTLDSAQRIQLYAKAEKLLIDQMVILPLYYYAANLVHKSNLANVYVDYDGSIVFARGHR